MIRINIVLYRYKRVDYRRYYLCRMMKNRQENRAVVYLDETWANAHNGKDCAWVERYDVIGGTLSGIKGSFQNHGGFIAALNHKRQYLIIILIVIIVIIEHLII